MNVHSEGIGGMFVYVDDQGEILLGWCSGTVPDGSGLSEIAEYVIFRSENDMDCTTTDPDTKYELLGEL